VYRRTGATVFFCAFAVAALAVAVVITVRAGPHAALVGWAVLVPLALLAVTAGVLPRLVVAREHLEVHNMVTTHVVPYGAIVRCATGRRGVAVRLASGRDLPVAALGHSFIASVLTGDELARRAVEDVNQRMADRTGPDEPATVTRNLKRVESAALAAVLLAAALVLIFV